MTQDINLNDDGGSVQEGDTIEFHHDAVWSIQQKEACDVANANGLVIGTVECAIPDGDGDISVEIETDNGNAKTLLVDLDQVEVIS